MAGETARRNRLSHQDRRVLQATFSRNPNLPALSRQSFSFQLPGLIPSPLDLGEPLLAMRDFQNPTDPNAIALRTVERSERDVSMVGYYPRYLTNDFLRLMDRNLSPQISVEWVNPPPAPVRFRVLCKSVWPWPDGFIPFDSDEYEPLVPLGVIHHGISPQHPRERP